VFFGTATSAEIEVVEVVIATGAETVKSNGTHFTVSGGSGSTGTVTAATAPASTVKWVINRNTTQTQETDYVENDPFPAESHEKALDRLTAIAQEQERTLTRTAQLPDGYTGSFDPTLPTTITANTALVINAAANGFDAGPTTTEITNAQTNATNAANSASAASSSASTASTQATLSTNYATKINGAVTGSDYASKAWAVGGTGVTTTGSRGAAKEWATTTGAAVDTSEFSSKEYSQGTTVTTGSAKQWALGGGSFAVDTVVAGGVFSAKKYAANAAASAAQAASGQIYSTVVNQTGAALSPALSADGTYFLCDTSSNNITVTLPAIGTSEGVKYAFQKTSASNSLIFQRSGSDTLNGSASNITITDVNAQIQFVADDNSPDNWVGVQMSQITVGAGLTKVGSVVSIGDNAIVPSMVQGTVNAQTGTAYTSIIGDAFKTITMSNTSANKVTLPPNSSVAYAVGDRIDIVMLNSGVTSVQGGSGVTLNGVSTGTGAIAAQYSAVSCLKIATNTWLLMGNHGGVA
tara:strand:- start:470 stop:2038 length:1569 start_codon:yes stop_codon:yes gene_type:complete